MAKKKATKKETKSEFLRKVLTKNPNLDHRQVNLKWAKAGHGGGISSPLYYKVRGELGIKTEWVWVKDPVPETDEVVVTIRERTDSPHDDLVEAAQSLLPHILRFFKRFEDKRPVMLLELPSQRIYAYPYQEFLDDLNERSQAILKDQYERAVAEDEIVVFVRDDQTQRLVSMLFHKD
jgi:hypothetical protein